MFFMNCILEIEAEILICVKMNEVFRAMVKTCTLKIRLCCYMKEFTVLSTSEIFPASLAVTHAQSMVIPPPCNTEEEIILM